MSVAVVDRPDPNTAQRRAADPGTSAWVAASAGTGKTKVLTDRVLNLLLAGGAPEKLLCLTFTKAAAAEMSTRIATRLARWAVTDEATLVEELQALTPGIPKRETIARARRLFALVLDAPGGLRVQTIHAFCQSLLGRFPLETGLPPHFEVMDEAAATDRLIDARDRVLLAARSAPDSDLGRAVTVVSDQVSEGRFDELLAAVLGQRPRLLDALAGGGFDGLVARLRGRLDVPAGITAQGLLHQACRDEAFDGPALRRAAEALLGGSKTDAASGEAIADWLSTPDRRVASMDVYRLAFLTKEGAVRARLATKKVVENHPDIEDVLSTEAARLITLDLRCRAATTVERTAALVRIADAVLTAYDRSKRRAALVDFEDLVLRVRDLLSDPEVSSWVLYKLDGGIEHVLIDEAQDTNPEQWRIIRALTEEFFADIGTGAGRERTVFAVGDVKQSIYSFQRADPRGFLDGRAHFARAAPASGQRWDAVDLDVSFRSTAAVLDAVDAVFAHDPARDGVVERDAATPLRHHANRVGAGGSVEIWPLVEPEVAQPRLDWQPPLVRRHGDNPRRRLADAIAATIDGWIKRGERLASTGQPIRAGDVMVLVRRRGPFVDDLLKALKEAGIDVAGADRLVLTGHLAVMDLIALGQVLLLPEDDLSLAAVLKGPLVGLSEEALFDLAWNRRDARLWRALRNRHAERDDWAAAYDFLAALLARADHVRPYELFAEMLAAGGRKRLTERLGPDAADPIDEFLAQALAYERSNVPSLQSFIRWIETSSGVVKRDLEGGEADKVRIMTVHGSKGLQAPIVFLPDTASVPDRAPLVLWDEPDGGDPDGADPNGANRSAPALPLWSPRQATDDPVAAAARQAAGDERDREYRRLLYVAMTRAEDRLYVCGWNTARKTTAATWHAMVARGLEAVAGTETVEDDALGARLGTSSPVRRLSCPQTAAMQPPKPVAARVERDVELPEWATEPAEPEPIPGRPLQPSRPSEPEPSVRSPLERGRPSRFQRGIALHTLLQTLPERPRATWRQAADRFLARPAYGLDATERAAWVDEVMGVLEHPDHAALFAPGSRAEVPIVGQVGDGRVGDGKNASVISAKIDRLAVTDDAVLIADFKTNRPPPVEARDVPALYLRQMAAYRHLVRRIYPGREVRAGLVWTDGPSLMWLPVALLDEAEQRLLDSIDNQRIQGE